MQYAPKFITAKGTGYVVAWRKHGVGYDDMKFSKPKAYKILPAHLHPDNLLPKECRKVEHMWCPFMTPVVIDVAEVTEPPKPIEPPKSGE
ncbi:Uncharacterized protein OBRU01_14837 [Operophtera brumata]|uniref:Uncharacterized protein n=1 Tax=Operophtera brumata TaxID=104452 RepID=A0A0L7L5M8_OPEBR|nr:Uncharacterized protein OBRU01_14837 [Operophtera brumata]